MKLSIVVITYNEEANIGRTLQSVQPLVKDGQGEIIVVDSGSTDKTVGIAESYGAKVFFEEWKGYAAQKNSAIDKAAGDWILSLDADEEIDAELQTSLAGILESLSLLAAFKKDPNTHQVMLQDAKNDAGFRIGTSLTDDFAGLWIPRKNEFLRRWIRHGGFWPDPKLRFFRHGAGKFRDAVVHETVVLDGKAGRIPRGALVHHSYPTLSDYIDHMNRYSSLGTEMAAAKGQRGTLTNIVGRPWLTFIYNYFFRLGFLDGREGLLLHLYHAVYVSWKYAKLWELSQRKSG